MSYKPWDFHSPCEYCDQVKNEGKRDNGCIVKVLTVDGEIRPRIPYVKPYIDDDYRFCHDCGVTELRYHHPGCDMETCPECGGQLISCNCDVEEENIKIPFEVLEKLIKENQSS